METVAGDALSSPLAAPSAERERVLERVRTCIAESLAIEEAKVELGSRLLSDLHADSLDFLEMLFAFEREFSVPLHDRTLGQLMRTDYEDGNLTEDGSLPDEDLVALREWLPALGERAPGQGVTPRQLFGYVTVESLVLLIERELEGLDSGAT